jgi:hypothetical protein
MWALLYVFIFFTQFFVRVVTQRILTRGIPVVARVLSVNPSRKGAQVAYSFEVSTGDSVRSEGYVHGGQHLKEGMPVIVCYQPDRPQRNVLIDYSAWKIELPGRPSDLLEDRISG